MPKVPYHPNGLRGSTVGVAVLLLTGFESGSSVINGGAATSQSPSQLSMRNEKANSGVARGNAATGKSQESTPPEPQFHSPMGLAK